MAWRAARLRCTLLIPVVALECLAQPLQLENQCRALRSDIARRFVARAFQDFVTGFATISHDAASLSGAARRTTLGVAWLGVTWFGMTWFGMT